MMGSDWCVVYLCGWFWSRADRRQAVVVGELRGMVSFGGLGRKFPVTRACGSGLQVAKKELRLDAKRRSFRLGGWGVMMTTWRADASEIGGGI